jgi:RNA polymerase-binding protein DksA
MSAAKKPSGRKSSPSKKTTARKATPKKTGTKKATPKKTAAKKSARKKPTQRKTTQKKTTQKKTTQRKTTAKETTAKKTGAKATRAKPATAKKTTAKKTSAKQAPRKPLITKPPPVPKRTARPMKLDQKTLTDIRTRLEKEYADLKEQWDEVERSSFEATQSDMTGEVGLDEDFADAGTATFERERDLSIQNNIRDLMDQISRAIRRIEEGRYGRCERCGNPIDAARLRALPHASLCMDCKRREERMR